jgi:GMP synthase-like glutamine amidotransferase
MTKSLIVNCSLKSTANETLLKAVDKFSEYTVVPFRDVDGSYNFEKDIDCVVISGSAARIVKPQDRQMFDLVVNLIKTCNLPILGICYGHQLLCWAFGAKVGSLAQPVLDKFENVYVSKLDEVFMGFAKQQAIPLSENHYDYVLKESLDQAGMMLLADSPSCEVEAIKHKSKPLYGVQFHPERIIIKNESHLEGHRIIENFYENVVKR